jgi:hypothetical protein
MLVRRDKGREEKERERGGRGREHVFFSSSPLYGSPSNDLRL